MVSSWELWVSLLKMSSFFDAISAAFADVARRIVLYQLQTLDHDSLIFYDTNGLKHEFGATANNDVKNRGFDMAASSLGEGRFHKKRVLVIELHIYSLSAWRCILLANDIGFAEAYMLGEVFCSDLTAFFRLFVNVTITFLASILSTLISIITTPLHHLSNITDQALINAQSHYSISNAIFAAFLDLTITYSAPL